MPKPDQPSLNYPSPWRRLGALFYDSLLLFSVLFIATLIAAGINQSLGTAGTIEGEVVHDVDPSLDGIVFQLYLLVVMVLFFCLFWRKGGQTLGMQAWRLRLESADGGKPSWGQCLLRLIAAVPALLCFGCGYWWIWIDSEHRSWHDRFSNTRVVLLPKQ